MLPMCGIDNFIIQWFVAVTKLLSIPGNISFINENNGYVSLIDLVTQKYLTVTYVTLVCSYC